MYFSSTLRCQCSETCQAIVKTRGKLYARGHAPASHSEERNAKMQAEMQRMWDAGEIKRLYGDNNVSKRPEVRTKIAAALRGVPKSVEHRAKLSAGRKSSVVCLASSMSNVSKAIAANIGSKRSEETRRKMSASAKEVRKRKTWVSVPKGSKLTTPAWNKGLTKETDTRVAKYAASMEGHTVKWGRFLFKAGTTEILMRSRWEVEFAAHLSSTGQPFQYEPRFFAVGKGPWRGTSYTPDFYLPERNLYVEIKGAWLNGAKEKIQAVRQRYPEEKILVLTGPVLRSCYGLLG